MVDVAVSFQFFSLTDYDASPHTTASPTSANNTAKRPALRRNKIVTRNTRGRCVPASPIISTIHRPPRRIQVSVRVRGNRVAKRSDIAVGGGSPHGGSSHLSSDTYRSRWASAYAALLSHRTESTWRFLSEPQMGPGTPFTTPFSRGYTSGIPFISSGIGWLRIKMGIYAAGAFPIEWRRSDLMGIFTYAASPLGRTKSGAFSIGSAEGGAWHTVSLPFFSLPSPVPFMASSVHAAAQSMCVDEANSCPQARSHPISSVHTR
ncbi:hypothetical protein BU23DRAFT_567376 [Bimuria novae-zelandiae CBS 107.79]|uniref:Uncharacterized protein n=1 Tax=Bimuria novae-zelandiae CBS 107.79 TaxID=1447943 RepID=A0A6A5VCM4_9PLEO|nr:hypothetical protein BU23DRAFT_567376 [Bimuria novae-zelandiae CBS 107.79]